MKKRKVAIWAMLRVLTSVTSPVFAALLYGVGSSDSKGVYQVDTGISTATLLFNPQDIDWYGATDGDR